MPKYLFEGRYSVEGTKGVAREGGSGRRKAIQKMFEGLGGKLESLHFAFGEVDAYVIGELPDNESAAAASLAVSQSGLATSRVGGFADARGNGQGRKEVRQLSAPRALSLGFSPARFQRAGPSC